MKRVRTMFLMAATMFVLTGCSGSAKKYDSNTLVVNGNGSLLEVAVEDFKNASVQAGDLEGYIDQQIDKYNDENGKKIKKNYINTEDMGNVKLIISYKDIESFNGFNLLDCKYMNYADADKSMWSGKFTSADGENVKPEEFVNVDKAKVLCLSEKTDVVIKGKVLYYNDQVEVKDGIISTSGEENAVLVIK